MQNLAKRLEKRGWSRQEIEKALNTIHNAKQLRGVEARFLEKRIYWILLVVIAAANFAISISLIPALMALNGIGLYFVIIVLGVVFGFLFELVIRGIEQLERRHHIYLAILIPAIALINAFFISRMSNNLQAMLGLENLHEPFLIGLVYAVSFVLPYIVYRFVLKIEYFIKE